MNDAVQRRVLLVDDDPALSRMVQVRLQRLGFLVDLAVNGEEGLAIGRSGCYDAILVDQDLPDRSGLDVVRGLLARQNVPMVMVTGQGNDELAAEAFRLGLRDYLVKDASGVFLDRLPMIIDRLASEQKLEAELDRPHAILRHTRALLSALYDYSPNAIVLLDEKTTYDCNNSALRLFGCETIKEILRGSLFAFAPAIQPGGRSSEALVAEMFEKACKEGYCTFEFLFRRLNGTSFVGDVTLAAVDVGGKQLIHALIQNVTGRKASEERDRLNAERLTALVSLSQMTDSPLQQIMDFALDQAVKLTKSEMGYLAFLSDDAATLTINSWSKHALEHCSVIDKSMVFPLAKTGLWGEPVRQRKAVFTNDYASETRWRRGVPPGHVNIIRHLGVPVFDGKKIVAVVGVGNKPADYDDTDVSQLTLLMDEMWWHMQRRRTEEELLAHQERLEKLVTDRTVELTETNSRLQRSNVTLAKEIEDHRQAQEKLRESLRFSHSLFTCLNDGVRVLDMDGTHLDVNPALCRMTGFSRDELIGGGPPYPYWPSEFRESYMKQLAESLFSGVRQEGEFAFQRKNGERFPVIINPSSMTDEEGHRLGYLSTIKDISDQKAAEAKLQRRSRELADRVKELDCLHALGAILQESEKSEEEIIREVMTVIPRGWQFPDAARARIILDDKIYATDGFEETVWRMSSPIILASRLAGALDVCYVEDLVPGCESPFLNSERSLLDDAAAMLGTAIARRRADAEVRLLTRQIEFILGASKTGLSIIDTDFQLVYVDRQRQEIYGPPQGRKCYEYFMGQHVPCTECGLAKALQTHQIVVREDMVPREDNRPVQVTTIPFQNEAGKWLVAEVSVDISERKRMEEELTQSQRLEAIGQLAAGIAHEINTPIQFIGDNLRFLKDSFATLASVATSDRASRNVADEGELGYLLEEVPKAVEQSIEGAGQVANIVRAMKEFSHPSTRQKQPVDLNRILKNTVVISRNEWKYVADVDTDLDPTLPPVPCLPGEIGQVFLNLIVNAAQAIAKAVEEHQRPRGLITVRSRAENGYARFDIEDNGAGIPVDIRRRVFDPFFTTKAIGKGTGQGLTVAHSIVVKSHEGSITFESEEGRGTVFTVRLSL
jgi:PAS domain S-box-containing protein